jgi:hypothetical protein
MFYKYSNATQNKRPEFPAFIHLEFDTHNDAWLAYHKLLRSNIPGDVHWIQTKHYKWVRSQTESMKFISMPMLVEQFFDKAKNGGLS